MTRAVVALLLLAAPAAASLEGGRSFLAQWAAKDFAGMHARLTPYAAERFPLDAFTAFWPEPPLRLLREDATDGVYESRYIDSEVANRLALTFDESGRVAGFKLDQPWDQEYPSENAGFYAPHRFKLPFAPETGDWIAAQGPHHRTARAQRFAYDLLILKDGATFAGDETDPRSYHAYGAEILSPAAGVVVDAVDGEPDSAPRRLDPKAKGNGVVLRVAEGLYLYLTHFRPGTVAVKIGDAVREGQRLGEVGSSGPSWEPHLHVQLMAGPDKRSDGLPLWWHDVAVDGEPKARALPPHGARVRALEPRPAAAAGYLKSLAERYPEVW